MCQHARGGGGTRRGRCEVSNIRLRHGDTVTTAERGREFWRGVLLAGGFTVLPRWTLDPVPGRGEQEARIPDELMAALRRLADELAVPLSSVLLTAHAKVLGALSGEHEVSTSYAAMEGRSPLLCRMTTEPHSWRAMLLETARAESELLSHKDFPVDDLRHELGLIKPLFETVFALTAGDGAELAEETVLRVGFVEHDGLVLRLRYKTDVLDADCAARIAGYHVTALALMASDPDAEHARQTLLSAGELRFQLNGLAGPRRKLPDCRVHELFEERVRTHPDAFAAVHGNRQWTYRELNAHANQLARALLARGLCREGVVAVVTERNLDWMAAVLAIFKAGGAYLPIEPHFPADRIARTLSRAACRLVLTERGSTATLDRALDSLSGVQTLFIDAAYEEDHADGDLGVDVAPDQLAYIYFTSGSTGEPKGAMCEHAGLLNHLLAKIGDLKIGEGTVVAETAPQCFDISLWQLISALLAGGRTLIIEQEMILGAPGEIVFSGVCVGRGYINDPERTQRAFLQDPLRPGQRVYRSGDYGRGLPDGKLEFLGRRDSQVKISGFRIEIGEIENQLLKLPGVREGAVVVTEGADQNKHLVAFCSGDRPPNPGVLRDQLAKELPKYMVPSAIHWRKTLPLTENGKIDRKALLALAREIDVAEPRHEEPGTATERRLAAAWAKVLGIPENQIGRQDHFFELGGTSLSALRLAIALDRAVSFKDLKPATKRHQSFRDQRVGHRGAVVKPKRQQNLESPAGNAHTSLAPGL